MQFWASSYFRNFGFWGILVSSHFYMFCMLVVWTVVALFAFCPFGNFSILAFRHLRIFCTLAFWAFWAFVRFGIASIFCIFVSSVFFRSSLHLGSFGMFGNFMFSAVYHCCIWQFLQFCILGIYVFCIFCILRIVHLGCICIFAFLNVCM